MSHWNFFWYLKSNLTLLLERCGPFKKMLCKLIALFPVILWSYKIFPHWFVFQLFYYCDICGSKFVSKDSLHLHKTRIHFPKPATCSDCGEVFPNYDKMRAHKNKIHNPLQCEYCDYSTGHPSHLKKHMAKHFEPQFQCSHCDKKLKSKKSLVAHEMEHTGERPYKCDVCAAGFTSTSARLQHKQGVHKIFGPKATRDASTVRKRIRK